jgi:hypothetical protein
MPPPSPKTVTRLDPGMPLLWRDSDTVQLGIDGEVRVRVDAPWTVPLLTRMAEGFRMGSFDVVAHGVGAPRDDARMLLSRLRPFLVDDAAVPRAAWVESIGLTDPRCEHRMREALLDEGVEPADRADPRGCGVIMVQGAAAALHLARYLRDDVAHLPIALERGRTTVGPLVIPGETPCLACRDGHERDRDPAWPRMHAQLIGRDPGPIGAARIAAAATFAARLLSDPSAAGRFVEISESGGRVWRSAGFHGECRCRAQTSRSPRGISTARAPLARPTSTTTAPGFARRA